MRAVLGTLLIGVAFGFSLSQMGFASWDELHAMFTFTQPRLLLSFITAVIVLAVAWRVIACFSAPRWSPRPIHPGTLAGGALFGVGWALSGACPAIVLVQLGEGQLAALWTLAGIVAGNGLYSAVHRRYFRGTTGSCVER